MNDQGTRQEPERNRASGTRDADAPPHKPHGNGTQRETDQKQDDAISDLSHRAARRESILYILAILGFFVAAVSAAVSYFQLSAMREQTNDARIAMQLEHRAWVFAESAEYIEQPDPHIRIVYANHGRTPATNVQVVAETSVTNQSPMIPQAEEHKGAIRIGNPGALDTPSLRPGAVRPYDVPITLWLPDFTEESYVVARLRISYQDVFGVRRTTSVCYALQGKDAASRRLTECAQHNQDVQIRD